MIGALLLALQLQSATPTPTPTQTVTATSDDRWFAADKVKHFLLAAFLQGVGHSALRLAGVRHGHAQAGSVAVAISLSALKERADRRAYGHFSVRDLVWSAAGTAASASLTSRTAR